MKKKNNIHISVSIIINIFLIGSFISIFAFVASIKTLRLLESGGLLIYVNGTTCIIDETYVCNGLYDCSHKLCEMNLGHSGDYAAVDFPGASSGDCEITTSFDRIWELKYYRLTIILGISSIILLLLSFICMMIHRISLIYMIICEIANAFILISFWIGIYSNDRQNQSDEIPKIIILPINILCMLISVIHTINMVTIWFVISNKKKLRNYEL